MIHWELNKRLQFGHKDKCYIHKTDSILENDTHKIHFDFEMKTGYSIPARIIINC